MLDCLLSVYLATGSEDGFPLVHCREQFFRLPKTNVLERRVCDDSLDEPCMKGYKYQTCTLGEWEVANLVVAS
jgi:hypothetical protein